MKKVLGVAAFAVLGVVALASCKKDYVCTYTSGGAEYTNECTGCNSSQKAAFETSCDLSGGTVLTK